MSPTGLDFLSRRYLAEQRREKPRCYGVSSNALATYALGLGPRPQVPGTPLQGEIRAWVGEECGNAYPADECDLAACERTFEMAPPHLQERMRPVLDEFTAWVRERRNRYGVVVP